MNPIVKTSTRFAVTTGTLVSLCALSLVACVDEEDTSSAIPATSGHAGTSGSSGHTAGAGGNAAGAAGQGEAGQAGKGGAAGQAGKGGAAGQAGKGGAAGNAGKGGAAGNAGQAGKGGAAGNAGKGGAAGNAGQAGKGGAAGNAGQAGQAGSGGASACLDASLYDAILTLSQDFPLCVTGVYSTDVALVDGAPQLGAHGGPMLSSASGKTVTVTRFSVTGSSGAATVSATDTFSPSGVPDGVFWGPAVDLFGVTLLSYTGSGAGFPGEVLAMVGTDVDSRGFVNGFFSGVGLTDGATKRLVYTGLSTIASAMPAAVDAGLYTYDLCEGHLTGTGCTGSQKVASWQQSTGPVASDGDRAVFADLSTFGADHEIRGFTKKMLFGSTPLPGTTLVQDDKTFTHTLAALAPTDVVDGWLLVSQTDAATFEGVPVVLVPYEISTKDSVESLPSGKELPKITAKGPKAQIAVFGGAAGAVWLALDGATGGTFVRLGRP